MAASVNFSVIWDVTQMMEAVRTSETLVHSSETARRYISKDSKL
jgi:hypothetical protein